MLCMMGYAYLAYTLSVGLQNSNLGCPVKALTGIPCPSCGVTTSIIAGLHGNFSKAFSINPLGLVVGLVMVAIPLLVVFDWAFGKNLFNQIYQSAERILKRPLIAVLLVAMVLLIWISNILT